METATTHLPLTNDNQTMMDDCLLRCINSLERLGYRVNSDNLTDVADILTSCLKEELLKSNLYFKIEPPPVDNWQSCERLQPETANLYYTAGFNGCMDEAIRYLVEEEKLGTEDEAVRNLKSHLEDIKDGICCESGMKPDVSNPTPPVAQLSCYMSLNLLDSCPSIYNFG